MKKRSRLFGGLGLIMALSLFLSQSIFAADYPYIGPQTAEDDYLYWGNADYPKNTQHGLSLSIQEASISFQSIIGSVTLDYVPNSTLIDQREITMFYVIANGRIVDTFQPSWDDENDRFRSHYPLRIALADWNIGSLINLQVVATTHQEPNAGNPEYQNQYVVAWSAPMGPYQLKPLPVIDRDAIDVLEMIFSKLGEIKAKLDELKNTVEIKLSQVQKAVEDIYTPSPAAEARLDAAMNNLQEKLPMEEIFEEIDEMNETMERTKAKLKQPGQEIYIGGEFEMVPGYPESRIRFMDLTEWREQLLLFRKICEAAIWVYFFYMLLNRITPQTSL